jgi:hypothetical protein
MELFTLTNEWRHGEIGTGFGKSAHTVISVDFWEWVLKKFALMYASSKAAAPLDSE